MKSLKIIINIAVLSFLAWALSASDRTDATGLKEKCDKESKIIEVPIKNFGDEKDLAKFNEGLDIIKQGKVKLAQSKFLDAKAKFEQYLSIQKALYESLSAKYIQRTQEMIDKVAEDLADFVGEEDVLKKFANASQNLDNAKAAATRKQFENVMQPCRLARTALIGVYTMVKRDIPKEYERDIADNANKIYEADTPKK
jgi:hypothetical protein